MSIELRIHSTLTSTTCKAGNISIAISPLSINPAEHALYELNLLHAFLEEIGLPNMIADYKQVYLQWRACDSCPDETTV